MLSDGWARRSVVDAFDDAEVALDAVGEGHQRLLVCLALVCRDGLFKAVELDQNDALRDSGFGGDDSAATGQAPPAPSLDGRTGQLVVGSQPLRVGNGAVDTDPVALSHGTSCVRSDMSDFELTLRLLDPDDARGGRGSKMSRWRSCLDPCRSSRPRPWAERSASDTFSPCPSPMPPPVLPAPAT